MSRVLVPYDRSEQAQYALEHATATFDPETLVLLHVVEPTADYSGGGGYDQAGEFESAEELLETVCESCDDPERVETAVRYGRPIHGILAHIDEAGVDHVVIGSRGRDGAARLLLGSVAETVGRRSSVPVTVVREPQPGSPRMPESVLVPFDASTQACQALDHAFDRFPAAAITALYVEHPPTAHVTDTDPSEGPEGWSDERADHARTVLAGAEDRAAERDCPVHTQAVTGTPTDAIVGYAEREAVDHVVVGSTGREGVARLLLGSVAETVIRRSPVSVTVAK